MQSTTPIDATSEGCGDRAPESGRRLSQVLAPSTLASVLAGAAAGLFFVVDVLIPRGATPAIGYTLVFVLASRSRQRAFLLAMACACTVLTWIGYFLEPPGSPFWMSIFDRSMITMVLWLTM